MKKANWIAALLMTFALLAGCAGQEQQNAPGAAVETYLQAIVEGSEEKVATVSCADWEETARGEVASFAGVKARLDGLDCTARSADGPETIVDCKGKIIATYNNEDSDFPLEGRAYKVVQEGDEWRVCGYGE